jgi:hypothetical protein
MSSINGLKKIEFDNLIISNPVMIKNIEGIRDKQDTRIIEKHLLRNVSYFPLKTTNLSYIKIDNIEYCETFGIDIK